MACCGQSAPCCRVSVAVCLHSLSWLKRQFQRQDNNAEYSGGRSHIMRHYQWHTETCRETCIEACKVMSRCGDNLCEEWLHYRLVSGVLVVTCDTKAGHAGRHRAPTPQVLHGTDDGDAVALAVCAVSDLHPPQPPPSCVFCLPLLVLDLRPDSSILVSHRKLSAASASPVPSPVRLYFGPGSCRAESGRRQPWWHAGWCPQP